MKVKYIGAVLAVMVLTAGGCGGIGTQQSEAVFEDTDNQKGGSTGSGIDLAGEDRDIEEPAKQPEDADAKEPSSGEGLKPDILHFVDVFQQEYEVPINPDIEASPYRKEYFYEEDGKVYYEDDAYTCRQGVDVSHHQKEIDWEKVKQAGYDFAFIRIGYRGYGREGKVCLDKYYYENLQGARQAGLAVGVYFFSQAISEEEAAEEAEFVLDILDQTRLELPVVFDPENILDDVARTDDVPGAQFTKNTLVFCRKIKDGGYEPMIYSNMLWEAFTLDLEQLKEYPVWYADYEPLPQTPYDFVFWQYSNEASVPGISGQTDVNIQMMPRPQGRG